MSKTKYVVHFCASCGKETKMEILGAMEGSENKVWYRCTRCHHSAMVDTSAQKSEMNVIKLTREQCTSYSPERIYNVGESIYHSDWDDMGKVTAKEKTSNGGHAIVVTFEKSGSRRLIENLPAES
jgi:DNA-directed RNA polymerase subunit RPC12/RpoP